MIVTCEQMRAIEEETFRTGVTAEDLMDKVGNSLAVEIHKRYSSACDTIVLCAGKGNNAGDGCVAAKQLLLLGELTGKKWKVFVWLIFDEKKTYSSLLQKKLKALGAEVIFIKPFDFQAIIDQSKGPVLLIDAILGIGSKLPLRNPIAEATEHINELKRRHNCKIIAVDIPTGFEADSGQQDEQAIIADLTITVGFPKVGMLKDQATNCIGRLEVIHLWEFDSLVAASSKKWRSKSTNTSNKEVTTRNNLNFLVPPRPFDSHKGQWGRIAIIAGSVGTTGAAILASTGALRAGGGLITLFATPDIYPIVASSALPEVMVKLLKSPLDILDGNSDFDIVAIGPGIGLEIGLENAKSKKKKTKRTKSSAKTNETLRLISEWPKPMILDADALNLLSQGNVKILQNCAGPRLLTPHPGEMKRLIQADVDKKAISSKATREQIVTYFTDKYPVTLLLKGARTLIGEKNSALAYNSTGNPGMATGGMGDTLTGILAALGARPKIDLYNTARLGAWLHGRAADILVEKGIQSEESLTPTELSENLGAAFLELRRN